MSGVKLQDVRKRAVLSREELAQKAGVSMGAIRNIENGKVEAPRPRVVRAISAALNVEPAQIDEFRHTLGLGPA